MSATTAAQSPLGGVLTPRMERLIRIGSIGSAVIIAVSAMILSYSGLHDLALDAQIHPRLALLVPIMVDGLQFVGSLGVVYSTLSGLRSWYPWLLMLMGVSISAWGNWQAAPDSMTAKLLHAAAPIILALVLEELLRVMRHKVEMHAAAHEALMVEAALAEKAHHEAERVANAHVVAAVSDPSPAVTSEASPTPGKTDRQVDGETSNAQPRVEGDPSPAPTTNVIEPVEAAVTPVAAPAAAPVAVPVTGALAATESSPHWQDQSAQWATQTDADGQRLAEAMQAANQTSAGPSPEPVAAPTAVTTKTAEPGEDDETLPAYPQNAPFKEQVRAILKADPDILAAKIARIMGKDGSHTRKTVRLVKAELDEAATQSVLDAAPTARTVAQRDLSAPAVVRQQPAATRPVATDDLTGADPFAVGAPVLVGRD